MADYFDPKKTALQNIDDLKSRIRDGLIDIEQYDQECKKIYATIFALRLAVNSTPGKKKTLNYLPSPTVFNDHYTTLMEDPAFDAFIKARGTHELNRSLESGHGGTAEKYFKEFVAKRDHLPENLPARYMPTANLRIETLQDELDDVDAKSVKAIRIYSEIFRTRRSVEAVHGQKNKLEATLDGKKYAATVNLEDSKTFKDFVNAKGDDFKTLIGKGHGGLAEQMYADYVCDEVDLIDANTPAAYMPTALKRTEALQKKLKAASFVFKTEKDQLALYAELVASRRAVGSVIGKKDTLEKTIDSKKLEEERKKLVDCKAFEDFIKSDPAGIKTAATSGHGGALEKRFMEYVEKTPRISADVPEMYMPTTLSRTEALQNKMKEDSFANLSRDEQLEYYIALMATRSAGNAVRGDKTSLERKLSAESLNAQYDAWAKDKTFAEFVKSDPEAAKKAALSGHGGLLEDKYREYIVNMEHIPADVPTKYMPTAIDHIEGLKTRMEKPGFKIAEVEDQVKVYAELLASRQAVDAVRGDKKSLAPKLNGAKLNEAYDKWIKCKAFKDFVTANKDVAYNAATSGHGGALEDKFREYVKNMDHIPEDVPDSYMPTAIERTEILQKKIKAADPEKKKLLMKELMATRMAVKSVRKDKTTLQKVVPAEKLNKAFTKLNNSPSVATFLDTGRPGELESAARDGHGGALDDKFRIYVMDRSVALGTVPEGVSNRFKPMPSKLIEGIRKDLEIKTKVRDPQWFQANQASIKKKVASMIYLNQIDVQKSTIKGKKTEMKHETMEAGVNTIMNSPRFVKMFETNTPQAIALKASKGMREMSEFYSRIQVPVQPIVNAPQVIPQNQIVNQPIIAQNQNMNQQNLNNQGPAIGGGGIGPA